MSQTKSKTRQTKQQMGLVESLVMLWISEPLKNSIWRQSFETSEMFWYIYKMYAECLFFMPRFSPVINVNCQNFKSSSTGCSSWRSERSDNPPFTDLTCNNSVLCLSVVKSPRHGFVAENVRNALIGTNASLFFPVNS